MNQAAGNDRNTGRPRRIWKKLKQTWALQTAIAGGAMAMPIGFRCYWEATQGNRSLAWVMGVLTALMFLGAPTILLIMDWKN